MNIPSAIIGSAMAQAIGTSRVKQQFRGRQRIHGSAGMEACCAGHFFSLTDRPPSSAAVGRLLRLRIDGNLSAAGSDDVVAEGS